MEGVQKERWEQWPSLDSSPVSHLLTLLSPTMCYAAGSIDHATSTCPMCKAFSHTRCPHVRETCQNRGAHPRMDVLYIKNAEVERFNGCGYCKWANSIPTPPAEFLRYNNPGWPGCCRAPFPTEYSSIPAADWRAVSAVHNVAIPPSIEAMLGSFLGPPIQCYSPSPPPSRASNRMANDRKNSGNSSPSTKVSSLIKTVAGPPSGKARSKGSPQNAPTNLARTSSGTPISPSAPSLPEEVESYRDRDRRSTRNGVDPPRRRIESSNSSPNRKVLDLESPKSSSTPPSRSPSVRRHTLTSTRPTVTPATTSVSVSKVVANSPLPTNVGQGLSGNRRRSSVTRPEKREVPLAPTPVATPATIPVSPSSPLRPTVPAPPPRILTSVPSTISRDNEEIPSSASSSSGSSDGMGSLSDNTVTSDGGFTDYLSDESEAELQRQAEAKAALVAINMAEELEFKAVRLQLAHVDLQPPKSWNPTNITSTSNARYHRDTSMGAQLAAGAMPRVAGRTRI